MLEVEYAAENKDGVSLHDCAESHRTMAHRGVEITNRYPKRVRYGNVTMHVESLFPAAPAETEALFEVVFDYGEHDDAAPTPEAAPGQTWAVRPDPFSSYRAGFEVRTYRLCQRLLVFHRFAELSPPPAEPGAPPAVVPCLVSSVDLGYLEHSASAALTLLATATHRGYVRQANGTYLSEALPPLSLGYSLPTRTPKSLRYKHNLSGGAFTKAAPIAPPSRSIGAEQAHVVDIDGNTSTATAGTICSSSPIPITSGTWYPSLGAEGFGKPQMRVIPTDGQTAVRSPCRCNRQDG